MSIGDKIIHLRKQKGFSQENLALQLHVARQTISNWENNVTAPDLQQAKQLSAIFGVSLDEMCENDIKEVLVDKVSNVERLAGIIIKIIKVGFVLLGIYLILMMVGMFLFSANMKKQSSIARVEADITCQLNEDVYDLQVVMDDGNVSDMYGDTYMIELAKKSKLTIGNEVVNYIEKYFQENGGTCE